ncbi:MAG: hypothetical protein ACR2FK_00725 [Sphingomicrobium sp.]
MRFHLLISAALATLAAAPLDAKKSRMRFDAMASVPCGFFGDRLGQCSAGVMRGHSGQATVRIIPPGGGERYIYFQNGWATSSDGRRFGASRRGRVSLIRVGHERYELPDSFVWGR